MATTLFLRDAPSDLVGAGQKLLSVNRGAASVVKTTNTTASGTNIQVTDTAGGQALVWFSWPLSAVTISGTVTVNLRGMESAAAVNAGGGVLIQRCNGAGAVISDIVPDSTVPAVVTEYSSVSEAAKNGTYTPTSTTLSAGDRIKVTVKVVNVGTMAAGTVQNWIDGPSGGASGDIFVSFTETFAEIRTGSAAFAATVTPAGSGSKSATGSAGFAAAMALAVSGQKQVARPAAFAAVTALAASGSKPPDPTLIPATLLSSVVVPRQDTAATASTALSSSTTGTVRMVSSS